MRTAGPHHLLMAPAHLPLSALETSLGTRQSQWMFLSGCSSRLTRT